MIPLCGQSKRIASIDSLLNSMSFSGAVLIADSSGILLSKGYGYADIANKIKNTPATRFSMSSASKVFTGTAITYLAQQGKLKFTDTLGQYLKGFPSGDKITIHQMLTHSAGLDDFFNAKDFSYDKVKNCTDMLPFMRSLPLVYPPGDSCIYSTGDCIVLGAIIEKITGIDFQDYIRKVFIDPLGLTNTSFTPYWALDSSQRKYAIGYRKTGEAIPYNYDNGSIPLSAGGAWSSVEDLYKFDKAVFSGKVVQGKYLSKMMAKHTSAWEGSHFGYIWIINDKSIGHSGDSSGWHAMNNYYPRQGYTVIILTNSGGMDLYELGSKVEGMLF
ncbi:CubicO group peptidase, beta-lactamase class C family [Chitinophaga niabensis]|uniref:CubicO group peptidase, beta-lactamase class C family n=2 Tax=Chitinophaga niabensis TaxID=536979 RepID=A0A1N6K834_9BACT|nr:CubicO group peptidase, beta-lactamase class C family [Chitinophaga niabensis]